MAKTNGRKPSNGKSNGKKTPDKVVAERKPPKGTGLGYGGNAPPVEHQFKPGHELRKGKGRNVLATVREYYNTMGEMTPAELQVIAKAPNTSTNKRRAALDMIDFGRARPDMADFEGVVISNKTLKGLRDDGIDTSGVKSLRRTQGKDGTSTALVLHDGEHKTIERVLDRTGGRPHQSVEVAAAVALGVRIEFVTPEQMAQVRHHDTPKTD